MIRRGGCERVAFSGWARVGFPYEVAAATHGDEAGATISISCAEGVDPGRRVPPLRAANTRTYAEERMLRTCILTR